MERNTTVMKLNIVIIISKRMKQKKQGILSMKQLPQKYNYIV